MTYNCVRNTWQHTVLGSHDSSEGIGIRFRQARTGAEEDLVCIFLENFKVKVNSRYGVTLFKEPCLESGVPDLVGVIWHKATADKWNDTRRALNNSDIRVMHYLSQAGGTEIDKLQVLFGSRLKDSIAKLERAEMIRQRGRVISPRPLSKTYASRHIFAIEAKVSEWRKALNQAFLNRWFATTSYVLLPRLPSSNLLLAEAQALGVGVWSSERTRLDAGAISLQARPESYASWLFNEWAWRASVS